MKVDSNAVLVLPTKSCNSKNMFLLSCLVTSVIMKFIQNFKLRVSINNGKVVIFVNNRYNKVLLDRVAYIILSI